MFPEEKLLMIPGPVPVKDSILGALASEARSHVDPNFAAYFQQVLSDMGEMMHCDGITFLVAGGGTLGMEMAAANSVSADDKVLVCSNGYFGDRYIDICKRRSRRVEELHAKWGECVTLEQIEEKLAEGGFEVLFMTHIETSTGAMMDLENTVKGIRADYPDLLIVIDGVAAGGAVEVDMRWGIDIYLSCTQKAFGSVPGNMLLWASKRAIERRKNMGEITESYVDFEKWMPVMEDSRRYWVTPAVNNVLALGEAIKIMKEEGYENRYERHKRVAAMLAESLAAIGFEVACAPELRSPTVSVFLYPEGMNIDDNKFRKAADDEGVTLASCLGDFAGKGFRLGHMANYTKHTIVSSVAAIERACIRCGMGIEPGAALAVLQKEMTAV